MAIMKFYIATLKVVANFFLLSIFLLSHNKVSSLQLTGKNHANFNVIIITLILLVPSVLVGGSLTSFPQGFHLSAGHWAI